MSLTNIVKTLVLDVYDHDQTQTTIKAIALDSKTRYVQATLTYMGADYPVSETAAVTLTVLRPDKVGAQVVGSVVDVDNADRTGTIKGVYAELTQAALAVRGKCLCQFKITDGEQILRTEIFAVNNGQALDADIESWAGNVDGHNLDEMAESIETLETAVGTLQTDVSSVKEEFQHNLSTTQSIAQNTYSSLLTNLPGNTSVWTNGSWWNDAPDIGPYFYVYSFGAGGPMTNRGTQVAINPSTLKVATRRILSGAWTNWVDNVVRDDISSYPVLYCFGDSLTQGAVWDSNQDTAYFIAPENDQMPTRIANAIGCKTFYNMGSSGARYVRQSGDSASKKTIVELIKEADLSTATIVVIGGGRNDSATALGTGATASANDGTICGAIVDVLEYLTTTYPKLQIVVFGVTPQPTSTSHAPSDIFTRVFGGGWSLNTFYAEVADVCERYGVPFIDWYGCTLMYRWGVLSGGYSSGTQNWSHPLSSDIYRQMGNYLGGRIASFYRG